MHCVAYCEDECAHGSCTQPNTCLCDSGWIGRECSQKSDLCSICMHNDYYCNRLPIADARPELNFLVDSLLKVGIAYCK